jgi:hypothetical protein
VWVSEIERDKPTIARVVPVKISAGAASRL